MTKPELCGVISHSGPNREPLACAYAPGHDGPHSWSTLPTFAPREGQPPLVIWPQPAPAGAAGGGAR